MSGCSCASDRTSCKVCAHVRSPPPPLTLQQLQAASKQEAHTKQAATARESGLEHKLEKAEKAAAAESALRAEEEDQAWEEEQQLDRGLQVMWVVALGFGSALKLTFFLTFSQLF